MTRSPTRLLRRLFGEPPMLELPLGRLFRRAYVHAQYESGNLSGSDSVAIPGKQSAASPLYLDGRREDLAFEKPDGKSADRRQHLRLWMVLQSGADGGLVWLGSASFGSGVTLSRDTGQVTRKIAPNIDQERDRLIAGLPCWNQRTLTIGSPTADAPSFHR